MGNLKAGSVPSRLLDELDYDGGWLTAEGLALQLKVRPDAVDRALYRLFLRGLVTKRRVYLAAHGSKRHVASRTEWSVA